MNVTFSHRLSELRSRKQSVLCVGLDPDPARIPISLLSGNTPEQATSIFCRDIIGATASSAVAFKINFAFFEALGDSCFSVMRDVLAVIPDDVLTIADAKRGDIGNSASFYARSVFDDLGYDSVTVSPYMGRDSVDPFLGKPGTCAFVLARTSNPGGNDLQLLPVEGELLYEYTARKAVHWAEGLPGETGLVVGATDTVSLSRLRNQFPDTPFLVPGVGAQGGSGKDVMDASGDGPLLVNSSRAILYASSDEDYATAAARKADETRISLGS